MKLDELIRATSKARNNLIDLEELSEDELDELQKDFDRLAREKVAARDSSRRLRA